MTKTTVLSATAGARSLSVKERAPEVARPEVTTADVLHRAADLLEEFGWRQGHVGSKRQGVFCALGAVNEAIRDLGAPCETGPEAKAALRRTVGRSAVAHWNDEPRRTKTEVVAALRQTANAQAFAPNDGVSP